MRYSRLSLAMSALSCFGFREISAPRWNIVAHSSPLKRQCVSFDSASSILAVIVRTTSVFARIRKTGYVRRWTGVERGALCRVGNGRASGLSTCRRGSSLADALGVTIAREREEEKGEKEDRARAGSTDRSRSAAKKVRMECIHRVLLARVAPGSRLTPAKEDEAGRRGSDAAARPSPPPPATVTTTAIAIAITTPGTQHRSVAVPRTVSVRTFNPRCAISLVSLNLRREEHVSAG